MTAFRVFQQAANDPAARLSCLRATAQFGWSRSVLLNQIKAGAYERAVKGKKTHNFALVLPEHLAGHAGKMDFYLNVFNEKERAADDQPSIGVAEYQLQPELPARFKGRLPTARQLSDVVREVMPPGK